MFPDYSGKYHGELNDKRTQMTEKISTNATVGKRSQSEKLSEFKGKT